MTAFGLELPKMVSAAYYFDKKIANILWQDTIQKKIEHVKIVFHIIPEGKKQPNGFPYVNCHMVFAI